MEKNPGGQIFWQRGEGRFREILSCPPKNACCPSNAPPNSETWRRHCSHILHRLLPEQNSDMKCMATRSSGKEIYNFHCRTERFKGSPIVFAITKYNERID